MACPAWPALRSLHLLGKLCDDRFQEFAAVGSLPEGPGLGHAVHAQEIHGNAGPAAHRHHAQILTVSNRSRGE